MHFYKSIAQKAQIENIARNRRARGKERHSEIKLADCATIVSNGYCPCARLRAVC